MKLNGLKPKIISVQCIDTSISTISNYKTKPVLLLQLFLFVNLDILILEQRNKVFADVTCNLSFKFISFSKFYTIVFRYYISQV